MKKRLTVLAALLACSTLMGSVHVYAEENEKNVVETAYGKVQGINSTDENYQEVVEFRGIPYAHHQLMILQLETTGRPGKMG